MLLTPKLSSTANLNSLRIYPVQSQNLRSVEVDLTFIRLFDSDGDAGVPPVDYSVFLVSDGWVQLWWWLWWVTLLATLVMTFLLVTV